jgi:hypothetical protein
MGKAWPRFFPDATAEATAHALLIEAHAILIEHLGVGHLDLFLAHRRAIVYARATYSADEIQAALAACAAAAGSRAALLNHCDVPAEPQAAPREQPALAVAA